MYLLMRSKEGKASVAIIILGVIILLALIPWYLVLSRNFDFDFFGGGDEDSVPAQTEEEASEEPEIPIETTPLPEIEPEPLPEIEQGSEVANAYTITDIATGDPELFRELNEITKEYNAVAAGMVLFDGNAGEFYTYKYGHADRSGGQMIDDNTRFRVASLAKLITVICAMVLVDEEYIDLDEDITTYLGYEVTNTNYPGSPVTTRMLMQHTSSIFDSGVFQASRDRNSSESVRYLLERGSSFRRNEPGSNFEYTNFGYSVLGAVCESVSGKSLDTLARDVLFNPLDIDAAYVPAKMRDTVNIAVIYDERHSVTRSVESQLEIEESNMLGHDLHLAQGNLTISVLDYARILAMLGNGGTLNGVTILSPGAVRDINNTDVEGASYKQGLGTRFSVGGFIQNEGFYWHTGSAYGTFAQYVYSDVNNTNRGAVVVTTGAATGRGSNGMVDVCTDLAVTAWRELEFSAARNEMSDDDGDEFD